MTIFLQFHLHFYSTAYYGVIQITEPNNTYSGVMLPEELKVRKVT